jgi:hypothetical protein
MYALFSVHWCVCTGVQQCVITGVQQWVCTGVYVLLCSITYVLLNAHHAAQIEQMFNFLAPEFGI